MFDRPAVQLGEIDVCQRQYPGTATLAKDMAHEARGDLQRLESPGSAESQ